MDVTWFLTAISLLGTLLNIRKNILCFYIWLIGDILWIIDCWTHQGNDDQNRDLFIEKTEIFKHAAPDTRFKRIWHYVEEHDYKMITDGEKIINERLNDFDFITIHKKLLDFCNYEKEKINSILKS